MKELSKNLCEILLENKIESNKIAIIYGDKKYTYKEVYHQVCMYGEYLRKILLPNSKMIIHINDQPKSIFLFLGAIKVGIHPIILNKNQNIKNVMKQLNEENVQLVVCDYDKMSNLKFIHINEINLVSERYFNEFYESGDKVFSIFSSGSSGKPKLISHSCNDVLACIKSYGENIIKTKQDDIFYCQSSLAFAYGIVSSLFIPFFFEASSILNVNGDIFEIAKTVENKKPTLFFAVPVIYKNLIRMAQIDSIDFKSIRIFISAGEFMPGNIIKKWEEVFNKTIIQGLGSTELLYIYISNTLIENKIGSLGKILEGYKAEIRDENGKKISEQNRIGELYISGNSLSIDVYSYNNIFKENGNIWLKTGDLATKDIENFYWYVGRITDNFKINGNWVDSAKISKIIGESSKVKEVIVVGELSKNEPTKIVTYIQAQELLNSQDIEKIKEQISKYLGRESIPYKFYVVDKFPRNVNGKIDRKKLLMGVNIIKAF